MLQNLLLYVGCYSAIGSIWRLYEILRHKKVTPRNRDTWITLGLAFILWLFVKI